MTYHEENVIEEERSNFMKKKDKEVDYQGTEYDYWSVMHYHERAFSSTNLKTLTVNNNAAYERQGRPSLGSEDRLSSTDITQMKRLYRCSGRGERGLLVLDIRYGRNLEDTDTDTGWLSGDPDPYVEVKAITSNGVEYMKKTSHKRGTRNPTWNEKLVFSIKEWQFFRIRVWDSDCLCGDDPMGMSVTVPLQYVASFTTRSRRYCANTGCNRYISYNYRLVPTFTGTLRVCVRYARNLPDTDPIFNDPDPYVVVKAFTSDTSSTSRRTKC